MRKSAPYQHVASHPRARTELPLLRQRTGVSRILCKAILQQIPDLVHFQNMSRHLAVPQNLMKAALQIADIGLHVTGNVADDFLGEALAQQLKILL